LFNHGSIAKQTIDFIDTFTADVFSTIEGREEFKNNTAAWVQEKAQTDVDSRSKDINVTPTKGTTINIGAAQNPAMNSINYSEEKDINVGKGKFRAFGGAIPNMEDAKLTLPYDSRTFYAKNGERVQKSGLTNITYNRPVDQKQNQLEVH
jgi:hypothetical protein